MLAKLFNSQKPASIAIAPFLAALFCFISIFHEPCKVGTSWVVFNYIKTLATHVIPETLVAFFFLSIGALLINKVNQKHQILGGTSNLPGICYIILNIWHCSLYTLHPALITNLLILLIIDNLFSIYRESKVFPAIFNTGFIAGLSAVIYPPYILLLGFVFISISIIRSFYWREWGVLLIGFFFPFYCLSAILYCMGPPESIFSIFNGLFIYAPTLTIAKFETIPFLICFAITVLFSMNTWLIEQKKRIVKGKKIFSLIYWFALICLASLLLCPTLSVYEFSLFSIPVALFFANYFYNSKQKLIPELIFFSLFISIVYTQVVLLQAN